MPALFRWFGSKRWLTPTIAAAVPGECTVVVSPFLGSGAFEYAFALANPDRRVVCFDIDPAVVNFHKNALRAPRALFDRVMKMHAQMCLDGESVIRKEAYDTLVRRHVRAGDARQHGLNAAARFFVLAAYSFSGKKFTFARKDAFRKPTALLGRLPTENLSVERANALEVLDRLSKEDARTTFVYLDPVYMHRRGSDYYAKGGDFDHAELARRLELLRARFLMSYNSTARPELRRMYPWARFASIGRRRDASVGDSELLISNFRLPRRCAVAWSRAAAPRPAPASPASPRPPRTRPA